MDDEPASSEALPLLARLYRERRSGVLSLSLHDGPLRLLLRHGQVVGLGPAAPEPTTRSALPRPDESARLRLEKVLFEVGIRTRKEAPAAPALPAPDVRERLIEALTDGAVVGTFVEDGDAPPGLTEISGATESLILEAVRAIRDPDAVHAALGDVDRRLVATPALIEERTLTLTEGYLLSRIDGFASAREVLRLVPLDADETERTLLGLLLTGRVEYRSVAAPQEHPRAVAPPPPPAVLPADEGAGAAPASTGDAFPPMSLVPDEAPAAPEGVPAPTPAPAPASVPPPTPAPPMDAEAREQRRQILEVFQSLPGKNHFEVLGVEPGCSDADVKRAYNALAKRYHPDVHRDPRLADLHDILEAIFIRVGEAWEVLGDGRSRAQYEARSGVGRHPRAAEPPRRAAPPAVEYVPSEEILFRARLLISQAQYWEAIQVLENAVPQMEARRDQHKGRILLARAYAKNPNWIRRAEECLHNVVREDPANVEAHLELGRLYKQVGHNARAQAAFRRVVELKPEHREAAAELGLGEEPKPGGGLLKRLFGRGKAS